MLYAAAENRDHAHASGDFLVNNEPVTGAAGPQGLFTVTQYQNATTTPTMPTGGTYDLDTAAFVPSTGWTAAPTTPGAGENTYASTDTVDPAVDEGVVDLEWSDPFQAGTTGPEGPKGDTR